MSLALAHRPEVRPAKAHRYDRHVSNMPVDDRRPALETASLVVNDDPEWLRLAYERHGSLVYTYCRRRLGPERAKDATQEVFTSAWNARDRFDANRGNVAAWLMGIAKNRVIDEIRSEQRHADRRADVDEGVGGPHASTDADDERIADRMLVADGLAKLPSRARSVIRLGYFEGLTHHEIASRTGLPVGTVKSDIRRGLTSIRSHLEAAR